MIVGKPAVFHEDGQDYAAFVVRCTDQGVADLAVCVATPGPEGIRWVHRERVLYDNAWRPAMNGHEAVPPTSGTWRRS